MKDKDKGIHAKIKVVRIHPNIPPADGITTDASNPKIGKNQTPKNKLEYGFIIGNFSKSIISIAYHPAREYARSRMISKVYPRYELAEPTVGLGACVGVCSGGISATGSSELIIM